MVYTQLPGLCSQNPHVTICVRVVRKWYYRGSNDDGDIQHADFLLADNEGNAIYAIIRPELIPKFDEAIKEGEIYEFSRFKTMNARDYYRPVEARHMIEFTYHTKVVVPKNPSSRIPHYIYTLTPFEELPMLVGNFKKFIDILGVIVEVTEPTLQQLSNSQKPALRRKITIRNIEGAEMKVTLWGRRATAFNISEVYDSANPKPIITLFVGGLMKSFKGEDYLSGSSPCKWYFNPEIPEVQEFRARLANERIEIRHTIAPDDQTIEPHAPIRQEIMQLSELQAMDPYEFPQTGFQCTVTITRLVEDVAWWFASCGRCGKSCKPEGNTYRCFDCDITNYRLRYKLMFVATDGTAEAQMICFGQTAQKIVGKSVEAVMRVRHTGTFPPDIASIVSQKFTFAITMANDSLYKRDKSYVVNSVITSYGRQRAIPHVSGASSSGQSTSFQIRLAPDVNSTQQLLCETKTTPPPATPHTPSDLLAPTGSEKTAPLGESADKADLHLTKKRLTYDRTDSEEEEADDVPPKRTKAAQTREIVHPSDETDLPGASTKRNISDHTKSNSQKARDSKPSRS